jgi:hypothetical protein
MRGSSPRMTPSLLRAPSPLRGTDSDFKQPRAIARILWRAPGSPVFPFLPFPSVMQRGMERRAALPNPPCGGARPLRGTRSPLGAPLRRFLIPGPRFLVPAPASSWLRGASSAHRLVAPLQPPKPNRAAPVQPSSRRRGRSAPRSVPGTSRVRGYEPRPRAPRRPKCGFPPFRPLEGRCLFSGSAPPRGSIIVTSRDDAPQ